MSQDKVINVLIVDDSRFMQKILNDIVSSIPNLRVCDTARNGFDALNSVKFNPPDVILLDLDLPRMDGLTFLKIIMGMKPIPVIIVSSYSSNGSQIILDCLELGAMDYLQVVNLDKKKNLDHLKTMLGLKIKSAVFSQPEHVFPKQVKRSTSFIEKHKKASDKVVVIGSSTGGTKVVTEIISRLPKNLNAGVLVVQHLLDFMSTPFTKRLSTLTDLAVKEAEEGDVIQNGLVLVATGNHHMTVSKTARISLNNEPERFGLRPTVNMAMVTASETYRHNTVGVILSGMGDDGSFGMKMIKKRGGLTLAQDEESSVIFGMANEAKKIGAVNKFYSPERIAKKIVDYVGVKND